MNRWQGFTLVEMLIALAVFSIVMSGLFMFTGTGEHLFRQTRREATALKELTAFLGEFSDAVKEGKSIQYISSREIGIWKEDKDKDGRPYPDETVTFLWDGRSPGTIYRRIGFDNTAILTGVQSFELAFDEPAPKTRHVLVRFSVDGSVYQTSLRVRSAK